MKTAILLGPMQYAPYGLGTEYARAGQPGVLKAARRGQVDRARTGL